MSVKRVKVRMKTTCVSKSQNTKSENNFRVNRSLYTRSETTIARKVCILGQKTTYISKSPNTMSENHSRANESLYTRFETTGARKILYTVEPP